MQAAVSRSCLEERRWISPRNRCLPCLVINRQTFRFPRLLLLSDVDPPIYAKTKPWLWEGRTLRRRRVETRQYLLPQSLPCLHRVFSPQILYHSAQKKAFPP